MKKLVCIILAAAFAAGIFAACADEDAAGDNNASAAVELSREDISSETEEGILPAGGEAESAGEAAADGEVSANDAGESGETAEAAEENGPAPYSRLWLLRYAAASVAPLEEQVGDNGVYDELSGFPPADTYKLIVDYHNQAVWVLAKGEDGGYTRLEQVMICSTGGNGNWTPEGNFIMDEHKVRFGEFKSDGSFGQYWSQIYKRFYFHSLLYTQRSAATWTESSYSNLGTPVSHGCVRLFVPAARWIYYNIAPGTQCIITTEIERNDYLRYALRHGYDGATDVLAKDEAYPVIYAWQAEAAHEKTWEQVLGAADTPKPEASVLY